MRGRRRKAPAPLPDAGSDPLGLAAHVAEHLDRLRVKNYSEGTVEAAIADLRVFVTWCAERGITRSAEVTRAILERYQRWLFHHRRADGRPLSFRTQQHRLVAVRSFFKYLSRAHHVLVNPAADLELPRVGQRLPREGLTPQEAEQALAVPDIRQPLGLRDRAILETFYSTGMRRKELCSLLVYDVDAERGTVMIREGKGKKDRVVPIGERALAWVLKYQHDVRPSFVVDPDPAVLFLNELGEGLGPAWLSIMVRRYVKRAGITKPGSCHLFRHAVATLMLEGGADVRYVQEMLGHAKLDTTQIYTHVSIRALKAIHDATHPAARLARAATAEDVGESMLRVSARELGAAPQPAATAPTPDDVLAAIDAESDAESDEEDE
jgi:integrase/recombinase XerD